MPISRSYSISLPHLICDSPVNIGLVLDRGVFTALIIPGSTYSYALGINNAGQIVGESDTGGYLDSNGIITLIRTPTGDTGEPYGINNSGRIVGTFHSNGVLGFVYDNGNFTFINAPNGLNESAAYTYGINDSGQIVGTYFVGEVSPSTSVTSHGFVEANGTFQVIDVPGSIDTEVHGINNSGVLVGTFLDSNRVEHGFFATPVPEPASVLLSLAGLALLAGPFRRAHSITSRSV